VLGAMASIPDDEIKVEDISEELKRRKINLGNLNVYLRTMVERGVIYKVEDKRGFYRMDRMFKLYLRMAEAGIIKKKR
jgi:Fe2+ or Zn2+ uptake regulation protein